MRKPLLAFVIFGLAAAALIAITALVPNSRIVQDCADEIKDDLGLSSQSAIASCSCSEPGDDYKVTIDRPTQDDISNLKDICPSIEKLIRQGGSRLVNTSGASYNFEYDKPLQRLKITAEFN